MEIQRHGLDSEIKTEPVFLQIARDLNIPIVATNDVCFATLQDYEAMDALGCVLGQTKVIDPDRPRKSSEQYFKSCEESLIYTINKDKTYLYNNICYLSCPDNTQANETKMICECKFYKYFLNKDLSLENNNYICFSESEKCKEYIPVIDLGICVDSINDCIEFGYKIFYYECSQDCPINSELKDGKCFCLYSFYNDSKSFHCFSSEETCESKGYQYSSPQTKECFSSIDDCISKGYIYTYMNYCYKDDCPDNTEVDEVASISNHKICFNKSPYFRNDIENFTDFCTIYDLLDNSCSINYKIGNDLKIFQII
jgi:hypothetical protein